MFSTELTCTKLIAGSGRTFAAFAICFVFTLSAGAARGEGTAPRPHATQERATDGLTLLVGQAEVVRYAREPGTVIIGDPTVATASLATSDILVLTGLAVGETNLIVLDDSGGQIDRMTLRIVDRGDTVVLRRGIEREVLRCHPLCLPSGPPSAGQAATTPSHVIEGGTGIGGAGAAQETGD